MVLACESIFSRTILDARSLNLHTFSKVNSKYIVYLPSGQARYIVFTCPSAIIYKFYLPRITGQAPMLRPAYLSVSDVFLSFFPQKNHKGYFHSLYHE